MPGLLRGMARTAAIVGTAEATRNAVDRHQADKQMKAYSNAAANAGMTTQAPPAQGYYAAPPPPPQYAPPPPQYAAPAPAPSSQEDLVAQIERLGAMRQQGLLTDDEYAAAKAKLLAG